MFYENAILDRITGYYRINKLIIVNYKNELGSPLLGGDLGVGKWVIREIFTEISRPLSS